jgi:type I restriction enzyme M protein
MPASFMQWIAPSEKDAASDALEKQLWDAADNFRANSGLTAQQYSGPILGLIFLRFAEARFVVRRTALDKSAAKGGNEHSPRRGSRVDDPTAYLAEGVLYLTPNARYDRLLSLPEGADVGKAVNDAMADVEKRNPQLAGVLPRTYQLFASTLLKELLKTLSKIPITLDYDAFGKIYEYFLGEFARTEGQKGGEFYTPTAIVRLIVEILEPFHGLILDPACGSGGMFVQSARFVSEHRKNPSAEISVHGVEKTDETGRLCRMNLAVHGLEGNIRHGGQINSYYDDPHKATGRFDFVLANPPFNVNAVDKERLKDSVGPGRRFPFGLPRTDNANYLWIQLFYSALNKKGRAGFVMANSAADARSSEQEIRRQLIEARGVDVIVAVGPNLFYTVTLPCTLWFFDKSKSRSSRREEAQTSSGKGNQSLVTSAATSGIDRADTVLFIDARHIYRQIDRAHREWTSAQIDFLGNLVRLYRGEELDFTLGGDEAKAKIEEIFGPVGRASSRAEASATKTARRESRPTELAYRDIPGLCRAATLKEIEAQGWSLNPGRYVGVAPGEAVSDEDFKEQLETLNEELETLNAQARDLEQTISHNVAEILEA